MHMMECCFALFCSVDEWLLSANNRKARPRSEAVFPGVTFSPHVLFRDFVPACLVSLSRRRNVEGCRGSEGTRRQARRFG